MSVAWLWVVTDGAALDWILESKVMAFPATSMRYGAGDISSGDEAFIYLGLGSTGSHRNSRGRVVARAVVASPVEEQKQDVGGRTFSLACPLECIEPLVLSDGPEFKSLMHRLKFVKKPQYYGGYLQNSPLRLTEHDAEVLRGALFD